MKKIKLTKGKYALVDDADYNYLHQFNWQADKGCRTFYARRWGSGITGISKNIRMHREIMNAPVGMEIDHINRNGLDNRRKNLRICTKAQNQLNKPIREDNTSGFRGIHYHKLRNKWMVRIFVNQKRIYLGVFESKEKAKNAYKKAYKKYEKYLKIS